MSEFDYDGLVIGSGFSGRVSPAGGRDLWGIPKELADFRSARTRETARRASISEEIRESCE